MIQNLDELTKLNRFDLSKLWQGLYGMDPPKNLSIEMMQYFIAFEHQAKVGKGLTTKSKRKINQLQNPAKTNKGAIGKLKPGSQILRDWNGTTHKVEVLEDGFLWRGDKYRSLTLIAKLITGAHWSGPRFFGLTRLASKNANP